MSDDRVQIYGEQDPDDPRTFVVRRGPRKRKSLVLWSGGLDSTWALLKLLRESEDDVFVHHVHKRSRTDDGSQISHLFEVESAAIRVMRTWFADNERAFAYSESAVDLTAFSTFARDISTGHFFGAQAAMTWGFTYGDRIITGANSDDDQLDGVNADIAYRTKMRELLNVHLMEAVMQTHEVPVSDYLRPVPTRREQADYLPEDLRAMVVCCRAPEPLENGRHRPCGQCYTCNAVAGLLPDYPQLADEDDLIRSGEGGRP